MPAVVDAFTRADQPLAGSPFSDGSGLVWSAASGSPAISGNRVGGSGFAVVDLRAADDTVSATLRQGGLLIFRYVDTNNYWYVTPAIYSGANADTPPVMSYGYTWNVYRVVGGTTTFQTSVNGAVDYVSYPVSGPVGTYDPGHKVTITTSGSNFTLVAEGGGTPGLGATQTATVSWTGSFHQTATKYGIGGAYADDFNAIWVETAPPVPTVTSPNGGETINNNAVITWTAVTDAEGDPVTYDIDYTRDNGATWVNIVVGTSGTSYNWNPSAIAASTTARVRIRARDNYGFTSGYDESNANFTIQHNQAPNPATWLSPANGTTLDRSTAQTLTFTFLDPDAGDVLTRTDYRYRLVGDPTWITATQMGSTASITFAGNFLAAGTYEIQVLTYDGQAVPATGWSASLQFVMANTPAAPVITVPASGGTIALSTGTASWTFGTQTGYQVQQVADAAGVMADPAVPANVYSDTGQVTGTAATTARDVPQTYPVNNRYQWTRVRVQSGGLWSAWTAVRYQVSYTPPMNPALVAIAISGWDALQIAVTNPIGNMFTPNVASLETDTTGWGTGANTTLARSTAQALNGSASLSLTAAAAGNISGYVQAAVVPGQVYTAVASFRAATIGRSVDVRFQWYTDNTFTTLILTTTGTVVADSATGWTQATVTGQAPINATAVSVIPRVLAAGGAGEVHYLDQVGMFVDPTGNLVTNPDHEDGTVAGWVGTGTSATVTWSNAQAYTGRGSVLLTVTAAGASGTRVARKLVTGLVVGTTYTMSSWVYIGGLGGATAALFRWINASQASVLAQGSNITTVGGWVQSTITFTATETSAYLDWTHVGATTGTFTIYIDAAQVVVGNAAQPWVPPSTTNLITNPSFEVDTTGWAGATRDTTRSFVGSASGSALQSAGAVQSPLALASYNTTVTVSCYVYLSAGITSVSMQVQRFNNTTYISAVGVAVSTSTTGSWVRLSQTVTLGATENGVNFYLSATGSGTFNYDAAQVERGSVATAYVDGSLGNGYLWEAAENLLAAAASSFEDGTTGGWIQQTAAVLANTAAQAFVGTKSLQVDVTNASAYRGAQVAIGSFSIGTVLTLSAYVRSTTAPSIRMVMYDGVNAPLTTLTLAANTWTRVVLTATVLSTGPQSLLIDTGSTAQNATLYIDAVQIEQKDHPTAYGATGAANASTSRRQYPWILPAPAVTSIELWRQRISDRAGVAVLNETPVRVAAIAPTAGGTTIVEDATVASGHGYRYQAISIGANNTVSRSDWVA